MKPWLVFFMLAIAGGARLAAQVGGGLGGTTPTTGNGGQTSIQANPTLGSGGNGKPRDTGRSIYISGKVMIGDGSSVPQNVTIQRVCSGMAKTVAYTDTSGRFNFRWGDSNTVLGDAADAGSAPSSSAGGFGSSQSAGGGNPLASDPFGSRMMNCDVRASLAGFTSDTVNLLNRRNVDSPDIGIIVLRRIAGVEGSSISITSMMAPKEAVKAYQRGLQDLLKNKPAEAAKDFEKAVSIYPGYADAWMDLAKLRLQQQSIGSARAAMLRAMEADPKLVAPYLELGLLAAQDAQWKESGDFLDHALKLDPVDFPQAWYADAVAHYNVKDYDAAEKSAREAIKLDPRHANPRSHYLLGLILVEKQNTADAATELTEYIKLAPDAPDLAQVREQLDKMQTVRRM